MAKQFLFILSCGMMICAPGVSFAAEMSAIPAEHQPAVGGAAPTFSNPDQDGKTVSNQTIAGRWTVLYFYPKDDTPGCTIQAQTYTTLLPEYESLDVRVYGVSLQDAESHKAFQEKHALAVPLLVDQDGSTADAFGVAVRAGQFASRDTIVIAPNGTIARIDRSVNPEAHPASLLGWLKEQAQTGKNSEQSGKP